MGSIYCIGVFTIYNLMLFDNRIAGFEIKSLVLVLMTLIAILAKTFCGEPVVGPLKNWNKADWIAYIVAVISVVGIIIKLITDPREYELFAVMLSIAAIYILMRREKEFDIRLFRAYSLSNIIVAILLLISWYTSNDVSKVIALLQRGSIPSWVLLALIINAIGYCEDDKWKLTYGFGLVLETIILFINKNSIAITIFAMVVLTFPIVFKPTKRLIRSAMQIFFAYGFLLANMSLLAGYTPLLKGMVTYDLELSVYIELCLALVGVMFFHYWDKEKADERGDEEVLSQVRCFIQKLLCFVGIVLASGMVMLVCGGISEEYAKVKLIMEQYRSAFTSQRGVVPMVLEWAGVIGVGAVVLVYTLVLYKLKTDKRVGLTKEQQSLRLLTAVFLIQSIMLTQTMITMPMHVIFICLYMNQIRNK
ncbi:MAG: hypothetical protein IJ326_03315 [Lachnospiraceae bacterium]|nr:hypothetical protein [Lachnospiraceae bacterium]